MRVWLIEKDKTDVPVLMEAITIRYSARRECLVVEGSLRWYEINMTVDAAAKIMKNCAESSGNVLDLRCYGAVGFFHRPG